MSQIKEFRYYNLGHFIKGILTLIVWCGLVHANPNVCDIVRADFQVKGFGTTDLLNQPINGLICGNQTCCSSATEVRLIASNRQHLVSFLKDSLSKLHSILEIRSKRFDEFFKSIMLNSKKEFHEMFKKTYGVIYMQNSFVFTDFFEELESYYDKGQIRLAEALDTFFGILYQRMFVVINSQYEFSKKYLECVSEHMVDLKPFGDVPQKLSVQLRRSFVATRTFYKALTIGADVVRKMFNLKLSDRCNNELLRLRQCGSCLGVQGPGACSSYCITILQACLGDYALLDKHWNSYIDAVDKVADRLLGPFNLEMVVQPINIKISEAIMNFQENGAEVSQRVFTGCGKPSLERERRSIKKEPPELSKQTENPQSEITFQSLKFNKKNRKKVDSNPSLEKLILDIKHKIKDTRFFWSHLPYQYCNEIAVGPSANATCWNGTKQLVAITTSGTPSIIHEQIFTLQMLNEKLESAHQGQDVDLTDDSDETVAMSGSGSGDYIEGSADSYDVTPPPVQEPSSTTSTPPPISPRATASASLTKALIYYLLPIVFAWFGDAFSDLL